ncbi:MAG: hypothetical protein JW762_00705 [Dehalococcoidales bacterium]|nr:hypothetical protein [Dehalococcoidales bacterium]
MKKVLAILITTTVISVVLVTSLGVTACADEDEIPAYGYQEPAPESHDGVPEGSGTDGSAGPDIGPGPAPNSGDGDPDGSGF